MRCLFASSKRRLGTLFGLVAAAAVLATPGALGVNPGGTEVTVGSNDFIFSQNKQNEPALAVDAAHPNVLVAGANENIDLEACNAGNPTTCPLTACVRAPYSVATDKAFAAGPCATTEVDPVEAAPLPDCLSLREASNCLTKSRNAATSVPWAVVPAT